MKKRIVLIVTILIACLLMFSNICFAEIDEDTQEDMTAFVYVISSKGLNKQTLSDIIAKYKEVSKTCTNDEIATMLENAKPILESENLPSDSIESVNKVLRNFETEDLNRIIDTIDIDKALEQMTEGSTVLDLVKQAANNMSVAQKAGLFTSLLMSSKIIKNILTGLIVLFVYKIFLRCVIYKKAKQHAWAVLIPIYKDIVMLRICGMSAWWLLLLLVPVIGWLILGLVFVASRFMLAEGFGKNEWFGVGLWLLWPIFESILVFSRKTKYIGFEDEIEEDN